MSSHFQRQYRVDTASVSGTVASLVAFALMGWLITTLMWRPIEAAPKASPAEPRKTNSHRTLTA